MAARVLFRQIVTDSHWNPWVLEDRAQEYEHALHVMDEWTRAEPGHRYLTAKQLDERLDRSDRRTRAKHAEAKKRFERDRIRYDPERAEARLRLIELKSVLQHEHASLADFRNGTAFPLKPSELRTARIADIEQKVAALEATITDLKPKVGDAENVVDEHGRLPSDRRQIMLTFYAAQRSVTVRELRKELPELQMQLKDESDKAKRTGFRQKIAMKRWELERLMAVPPQRPEDMCSECPMPMAHHGWVSPKTDGPCPAWPGWAARIRGVREMIERFAQRDQTATLQPPKPKPLAVVPSGLPISDVITKLSELHRAYPDAEVRRGRSNGWELWPTTNTTPG